MKGSFFLKMAVKNIRANKQLYLPYMISSVLTVAMFSQMVALLTNEFVQERNPTLSTLFSLGAIVIGLFSFIFTMYTNSFLIKRRKKEIGLYGILGLEKKHVGRILFLETIIVGFGSILIGLLIGLLFGRLFFLLLNYLLQLPEVMSYTTSWEGMGMTVILFTVIFFVAYLYNISQVTFSNPIKLLKGEKEGEKEPKSNWFLLILGIGSLGYGYWISVTISDPLAAMIQFFLAVILVIIGTFCLFTAGSIFVLKAMKKNKQLYYQPRAFISISGMLYRMKQNATGLANISVLSCMVIIALATTTTIYVGTEDTLAMRFPAENNVTVYSFGDEVKVEQVQESVEDIINVINENTEEVAVENQKQYIYANLFGKMKEDYFEVGVDFDGGLTMPDTLLLISLDDYNQFTQSDDTLADNQVYIHHSANYQNETIKLSTLEFDTLILEKNMDMFPIEESISGSYLIVVPSKEVMQAILSAYQAEATDYLNGDVYGSIQWDTSGTEEEKARYSELISEKISNGDFVARYESRSAGRDEWYMLNGGFLFLGIFLGLLFTIGTVLITYYKQISEGYDDRERFQIMQKVGLDKDMIRSTSRSQVVWMFMLPLIVATVHTAFAYPIIHKLLMLFGIFSHTILISCIAGVVLSFSVIYWLIYRLTARIYFSIVE
ncbi:FtsX-like permease family protein [Jeotgalibaca ciconiae]|uniref:FtsX-like permease family protein n=1 Tax=Jeotgalibaca ciconiae TaxID=2496265 RepID=UPI001582DB1B|nr:ABC transporter permease [Jeotgalibaca ciconiae]